MSAIKRLYLSKHTVCWGKKSLSLTINYSMSFNYIANARNIMCTENAVNLEFCLEKTNDSAVGFKLNTYPYVQI